MTFHIVGLGKEGPYKRRLRAHDTWLGVRRPKYALLHVAREIYPGWFVGDVKRMESLSMQGGLREIQKSRGLAGDLVVLLCVINKTRYCKTQAMPPGSVLYFLARCNRGVGLQVGVEIFRLLNRKVAFTRILSRSMMVACSSLLPSMAGEF